MSNFRQHVAYLMILFTRPILFLALLVMSAIVSRADVRLPEILEDHMVLQQKTDVQIWGWAFDGETVTVESSWGAGAQTVADRNGEWRVKLKTPAAQTLDRGVRSQTITVTAPGENSIQLKDILIGEVWVCSGQSNMAMILGPDSPPGNNNWFGEMFWSEESKHANRPAMRLFNVQKTAALTPRIDCRGMIPDHIRFVPDSKGLTPYVLRGWQPCTVESAGWFSAIAYYFGAAIQDKLNVPVGLVTAPVGGTGIEPWISQQALRKIPGKEPAAPVANRGGDSALFNGMIAPLTPMKIRGVLWYQGESSIGMGCKYALFQTTLINDWRQRFFDASEMPFYLVQLTAFGHDRDGKSAEFREAQATALQLNNTGMAVTLDVGEPDNIHPKNKRDIGRRLAYQALNKTYGCNDIVAAGPTFQSVILKDGKLRITFRDVDGGLVSRDGKPLNYFEVAGPDGKFLAAEAQVEANDIVVFRPDTPQPKWVRFAWGDGDVPNLMAKNGLPMSQFRVEVKNQKQ